MMGDDELKASIVNTISLLAAQQQQFAEFQTLIAKRLTANIHESESQPTGSTPTSHLNAFKFAAFDETAETFTDFVDRLESFFQLQSVKSENQAGCLVTALSPKLFKLLKNLLYPETYGQKTYGQIKDLLKSHLNPVPLVIPSRHALFTRRQLETETITEYLTELQQLATHCKYNAEILSVVLRDVFVSGLRSRTILDRLFQEDDPSLAVVVKIAQSIERAEGATHEVLSFAPSTPPAPVELTSVNVVKAANDPVPKRAPWTKAPKASLAATKPAVGSAVPPSTSSSEPSVTCYSCGESGHRRAQCQKTGLRCTFCGRDRHVEAICLKKRNQQSAAVKHLGSPPEQTDDFPYDEFALYQVTDALPRDERIFVRVTVEQTPITFELDSGSRRTLVNQETFNQLSSKVKLNLVSTQLFDYNGNPVAILGEAKVRVSDSKRTLTEQPLLVVRNRSNVLGRDWMNALGWLTNSSLSFDRVTMHDSTAAVQHITSNGLPPRLQRLLSENQELFTQYTGRANHPPLELDLLPTAQPVFRKARVIPMAIRAAVEAEIAKLVQEGVWEPVTTSDWATPIVPVVKAVGVRLCGDYSCTVNPQIKVAQHPFPGFDEVFASLVGGKKFTKLDVRAAFLHLPVTEETAKLLTVNTHMGLFKPTRLMYGVSSAPALWQKFVDAVFASVPCCVVHDDIIVTGTTDDEHIDRLTEIFKVCRKFGLRLNVDKCRFFQAKVEFLGFKISEKGIHKTAAKIDAVLQMPEPTCVTEVKSFLGLVTFYARFLPDLATLAQPLYELTQKDHDFTWTQAHETSFRRIKQEVASDRVLLGYDPKRPLVVAVDASPVGLGAVLSHRMDNGEERPIAFASRTLNAAEKRYSQIDKEALAIRWGIFKFYHYLYGVRFTLLTDHQPLTHIFNASKKLPQLSATRMLHYATELRLFNFDIVYRPSKLHGNADCLSRLPTSSENLFATNADASQLDSVAVFQLRQFEPLPLTAKQVAAATLRDPDLAQLVQDIREGKALGTEHFKFSLLGNVIFNGTRVYVPADLRKQVLQELHEGHFGVVKMKALARAHVYWPKLDADIERIASACPHCVHTSKNPPKVTPHAWIPASRPWERIHVDFAEFKKHSLFVLVDAYSKWPEVFPVAAQTAAKVIEILQELFARYGVPRTIVSDNGAQFTSAEFQRFVKNHNITHKTTAPFHPATNGQAERYVGTIKTALRTLDLEMPSQPLRYKITRFLFAYRRTPHVSTGASPAERFLGRCLRSALDFLKPDPSEKVRHDLCVTTPQFSIGERVAFRNYAHPNRPWNIGTILSQEGPLSYTISVQGVFYRRHVNQIRRIGQTLSPMTASSAAGYSSASSGGVTPADPGQPSPPAAEPTQPTSPSAEQNFPAMARSPSPEPPPSPAPVPPVTPELPRRSARSRRPPCRFSP